MKPLKIFFAALGLVVWTISAPVALAAPVPDSFADLAEEHLPAVVNISTTQIIEMEGRDRPDVPPAFRDFFDDFFNQNPDEGNDGDGPLPPQRALSLGSGFIISPDGYVVTNNHVISEADEISIRLTNGEDYDAVVVGRDPRTDLALLKIDADGDLPYVEFGDSDAIRVGEWIMTIGNPFGLGGTVTVGIVSARNRDINSGPYDDFIQTDASINRGNSGGPMFNMDGEVIGVNTMIFSPTGTNIGIGFAIPSNQAQQVIEQLVEFGRTKRGWIGVTIEPVTDDVAESLGLDEGVGALINETVEDGPSETAGILPGDIIIEFDGEPIEDWRELPRVVANTGVDKTVDVVLLRGGEEMTVSLETGELETEGPGATSPESEEPEQPERPQTEDRILGMVLVPLTDDLRQQFDIPEDIEGVLVETLSRSSEAAIRDIRPGDVIVQASLENVREVRDIETAVEAARRLGRGAVLFRIYRGGTYLHRPIPVGEAE